MMRELQFARMFCDSDRMEGISLEICVPNFSEIADRDKGKRMKAFWCSQRCTSIAHFIASKGGEVGISHSILEFIPEAQQQFSEEMTMAEVCGSPSLAISEEEYREIQLREMDEDKFGLWDVEPVIDAIFVDPKFDNREAIGDLIQDIKEHFPLVVVKLLLSVDYYHRNKEQWPHVVDFTAKDNWALDSQVVIIGPEPEPDMRPSLNN